VPLLVTTTFVRLTVSLLPTRIPPPTPTPGFPLRTVKLLRLSMVVLTAALPGRDAVETPAIDYRDSGA
jgi:hypothetical protein